MQLSPRKMKYWLTYLVLLFCQHYIECIHLFRCDYTYNSAVNGWFKYHEIPATWMDARLRCAGEGAVLAAPTTPKIKTELTKIANSTESELPFEIFTGIHATFSQGAYFTVDGIPLSKIPKKWAPNEPDNKGNKESCLTMNYNGELADLSCEETRPYVCYRSEKSKPGVTGCGTSDPEYVYNTETKSCYKFHNIAKNFTRAFFTCAAEGGHLAVINSELEATVLKGLYYKHPGGKMRHLARNWVISKEVAFIGFSDWGEQWDFRTINGQTIEEAGYSIFKSGEPNNRAPGQSCGAMYRSGYLDDMWCNVPAPFICEKSPDYNEPCRPVSDNDNVY